MGRYSGNGRTGVCKCGHPWQDHHLGIVMNETYFKETGEVYVPQECEAYGFNELGGLQFVGGQWVDHCHNYVDSSLPDAGTQADACANQGE